MVVDFAWFVLVVVSLVEIRSRSNTQKTPFYVACKAHEALLPIMPQCVSHICSIYVLISKHVSAMLSTYTHTHINIYIYIKDFPFKYFSKDYSQNKLQHISSNYSLKRKYHKMLSIFQGYKIRIEKIEILQITSRNYS